MFTDKEGIMDRYVQMREMQLDPLVALSREDFENILMHAGSALVEADEGVEVVFDIDWGDTMLLGGIEFQAPSVEMTVRPAKHCLVCDAEYDAYDGVCDCE